MSDSSTDNSILPLPLKAIQLAPMEGVIDSAMRQRLTGIGGYDRCVTEFVRVSDVLLPPRVFHRFCPELESSEGHTASGVPVYLQLLGSNPEAMAVNGKRAAELGAPGIDLNFGCPAKTVNNSMGGSILLQEPERVGNIVKHVRDAVPAEIPVTVKIRLGYHDDALLQAIVNGVWQAGADELAIHAHTKFDGYKPPAHWAKVAPVSEGCESITCINGEIWNVGDAAQAMRDSRCQRVMLGRSALAAPDLAKQIASAARGEPVGERISWAWVLEQVEEQFRDFDCSSPRHVGNRTKQWLAYLKRHYREVDDLFTRLRRLHEKEAILAAFAEHRQAYKNGSLSDERAQFPF